MIASAHRRPPSRRDGFTLAEVLAAMLIMAIVIPVVVQGALLASRVGTVAERERKAARLADTKLTELLVTDEWRDGDDSGTFTPTAPDFSWRLTSEAWEEDTMRVVSVEVSFQVQGETYTTRVATLAPEESSDGTTSDDSTEDAS